MSLDLIPGISLKRLWALLPSSVWVFIGCVSQEQSGSWGFLLSLWRLLTWRHLHPAVILSALPPTLRSPLCCVVLSISCSLSSLWASAFPVLCLWSLPCIWILPQSGDMSSIICTCLASWESSLGSPVASPFPPSLGSLSTAGLCLFLRISHLSLATECFKVLGQGRTFIFHFLSAKALLFRVEGIQHGNLLQGPTNVSQRLRAGICWASGDAGIRGWKVIGFHCLCLSCLILTGHLLHFLSVQTGFLCFPGPHGRITALKFTRHDSISPKRWACCLSILNSDSQEIEPNWTSLSDAHHGPTSQKSCSSNVSTGPTHLLWIRRAEVGGGTQPNSDLLYTHSFIQQIFIACPDTVLVVRNIAWEAKQNL